jgi:hypothetical protein
MLHQINRSWDIPVVQHWATGCMIGGFSPSRGWEFSSSLLHPDQLWVLPSLLSNAYQGLFLWGVKWPGHEADYPPPSSAIGKECVELYPHSPNTPSWCGAQTTLSLPLPLQWINSKPCSLITWGRENSQELHVDNATANMANNSMRAWIEAYGKRVISHHV